MDIKRLELCSEMVRNILSVASDLLFKVFFLSESLEDIASLASIGDAPDRFPSSAMKFGRYSAYFQPSNEPEDSSSIEESLNFEKSLFSNPSYTVQSLPQESLPVKLDLAFSSFLVSHPLKSTHHFNVAIAVLKKFYEQMQGMSNHSTGFCLFSNLLSRSWITVFFRSFGRHCRKCD